MATRLQSGWFLLIAGIVLVIAFATVWAAAPDDLRGLYLLAGGAIAVVVYASLYLIQRRRHW